jgi:hypothetical protein
MCCENQHDMTMREACASAPVVRQILVLISHDLEYETSQLSKSNDFWPSGVDLEVKRWASKWYKFMVNTEYIWIELKQAGREGYRCHMIRQTATYGDIHLFLSHMPTVCLVKMPLKFNRNVFFRILILYPLSIRRKCRDSMTTSFHILSNSLIHSSSYHLVLKSLWCWQLCENHKLKSIHPSFVAFNLWRW